MSAFLHLISIITALVLTLYIKPRLIETLYKKNMIVTNYSGRDVINGAGLIFFIPCMLSALTLWKLIGLDNIFIYIILLLSMTLIGYIDDSLETSTSKGFKGHIKSMMSGELSTGIIKLIVSVIIGTLISAVYYSNVIDIALNTILFCLCVNFINLLDLRPGRGIKGFILFTLFISVSSGLRSIWILLPIYSSLTIYTRGEMEEIYMLGDTGANLLGGVLGFYILKAAYPGVKYALFIILIFLHIIAEFKSLSNIIDSIPLLKYMDSFGQLKKERS
ncbi:MAG: hypothetical protein WBI74_06945 [Caldicoprobacterales bacterium]|nr:hypothetical protein [Clostridiales bacterium]